MLPVAQTSRLLVDYDRLARSVRMRLLDHYHTKRCGCRWKRGAETPGWPLVIDPAQQNSYSKTETSI